MKYTIEVSFNADRELTQMELDQLLFALSVQIEEPVNAQGDDEEFTTSEITVEVWKFSCGACGEICEPQDGTIAYNSGLLEFTHKAELCPAQDEIKENK